MNTKDNTPDINRLILDHLGVETITLDEQLCIKSWSAGTDRFGVNSLNLVQSGPVQLFLPVLAGREAALQQVYNGQTPLFQLSPLNFPAPVTARVFSLTVLPDPTGTGLVCLLQDISQAHRIEESFQQQSRELDLAYQQLEEQKAQLKELNWLKTSFVSMTSHELRSPLTGLKGFLDLVLEGVAGPLNEEQRYYLSLVSKNTQRLTKLTEDLKDIEQIESGKLGLTWQVFDLYGLTQVVAGNFQGAIQEKELKLEFEAALENYEVIADLDRTEQILANFLSNAVKFSATGGRIVIGFEEAAGNMLLTNIKDNGTGISEADQPKLFERFFRANNPNLESVRGNGLGLSICRALVELQGGKVQVKSKPGEGSTFSFTLPFAPPPTNE